MLTMRNKPGRPTPDIAELCVRHQNEDAHTRHVADMSLRIFDASSAAIGMPASARRLLKTAALLHDIGYASDPDNHGRAGARIVLKEGVKGLSPEETAVVSAAILLHKGKPAESMRSRLFALLSAKHKEEALKLAAILRVADGLDHRHDQKTTIRSVSAGRKAWVVRIQGPSAVSNLPWALAKADLWSFVFATAISIVPNAQKRNSTARQCESAISVARRLLAPLLRDIKEKARAAVQDDDPEHLHELRGAIRRFRCVLKIAGPLLSETSAAQIETSFGRINDQLGKIRDGDILRELRAQYAGSERQAAGRRTRKTRRSAIRRISSAVHWTRTIKQASILVRSEIPAIEAQPGNPPAAAFVSGRLAKLIKRISKQSGPSSGMSPEELHALRKLCRRARYWAELFHDQIGSAARPMARKFRAVTEALGAFRDLEMALQSRHPRRLPASAIELMRRERDRMWEAARHAWKQCVKKGAARRIMRQLKQQA